MHTGLHIPANHGHGSNKGLLDMNTIDTPVLYTLLEVQSLTAYYFDTKLACVACVRSRGKGARQARVDRTREDRVLSPSRAHFHFPAFLRTATQAITKLNLARKL